MRRPSATSVGSTSPEARNAGPRWRPDTWGLAQTGLCLAFLLLVYAPLAGLLLGAVREAGGPDLVATTVGFAPALLAKSLGFAGIAAAAAMLIGVPAGFRLWRCRGTWCIAGRAMLLSLLVVPPIVQAIPWAGIGLQGWVGALWTESLVLAPVAALFSFAAFSLVDPEAVASARVLLGEWSAVRKILFPLALPLLSAGACFAVVLALVDHTVPSIFSANTYAFAVFAEFAAGHSAVTTLLAALPLVAAATAVVLVGAGRLRYGFGAGSWVRSAPLVLALPRWWRFAESGAVLVLALHATMIGVALLSALLSGGQLLSRLQAYGPDTVTSLVVAASTVLLVLPLAAAVAVRLERAAPSTTGWWILAVLPLAVPAPLVGVGLIAVASTLPGIPLYGTLAMPVLGAVSRFAPIAAVLLAAGRRSLDPGLVEAAAVLGWRRGESLLRLLLPLHLPALLAVSVFGFSQAVGEVVVTLLLVPPGDSTLALRLYDALHYGATGAAALAGVLMVALLLVPASLLYLLRRQQQPSTYRHTPEA